MQDGAAYQLSIEQAQSRFRFPCNAKEYAMLCAKRWRLKLIEAMTDA
jgi:hypothetical protein